MLANASAPNARCNRMLGSAGACVDGAVCAEVGGDVGDAVGDADGVALGVADGERDADGAGLREGFGAEDVAAVWLASPSGVGDAVVAAGVEHAATDTAMTQPTRKRKGTLLL